MAEPLALETSVNITVTRPTAYQGLTIWCGDSLPVHVDDFAAGEDLRDLIQNPILRAVTVTRLRAVADLLDGAEGDDQ